MLRLRFLTAAIGLPLIILAIALGLGAFSVFIGVVAVVGTYELCGMAPGLSRFDPLKVCAVVFALALALWRVVPDGSVWTPLAVTVPLLASLLILLGYSHSGRTFVQWSCTIGAAVYVGWLMGHWEGLFLMSGGRTIVIFGMATTFAYDTFAFFTGRAIGRHKLAPHLSAGKTWEGVVGGALMATVVALAVRQACLSFWGEFPFSVGGTAVIALGVAAAAQVGDLVESAIKRSSSVKDTGHVLPGHGGMLDRFDSLLFVGPMLYYLAVWVVA